MRRLFAERLESRQLLAATDLAAISGLVFDDFTGDGFNAGEEAAGATLSVHRDNGNGVFDQGADTLVQTVTTGANGRYVADRLTAGNYFVLQDAQVAGGRNLQRSVSPIITIDGVAVEGRIIRVVDSFDQTEQQVVDTTNDGVPVTSTIAAPEAIGGERDLFVNKTSVNGAVQLNVDNPLLPNLLTFDSLATGNGDRRVTWDGVDGDATVVADGGLGSEDLSSAGDAIGLQLQIGADLPGGQAVVRLYTDDGNAGTANRFSTATLTIPQTGGSVSSAEFLPFSSFIAAAGGGVDINNVGAIELEITGAANVNGTAELVGTVGQNVFTADFDNFETADLSLTKTVNNASPGIGQNVTFTITVSNAGPDNATGVAVRDNLPAGITFVSSVASTGNYNSGTGIWTVGSVTASATASLQITGRVDAAGTRTNFAEISAADQFDPDSQPDVDNTTPDDTSQDDQALVTLTTEAIDLSVTKTASATEVSIGQNVTFTVTVANAGPSTATGVVVTDLLPAGTTFVSSAPSQGTYSSATGQWVVGSVTASATASLQIVATVSAAGNKTNTAQVTAANQTDVDSTPNNNLAGEDDQASVVITSPQIDLSLSKMVNDSSPGVGQNVTYTLQLSNAGPDTATGVTVLDLLPAGVTFVSSTPSQGSFNNATGIWNVGSVTASATATLQITVTANSTGSITNTAQVQSANQPDADSTPGNNLEGEDDQASVVIVAEQIDLSITKTANNTSPNRGDNVTFTVTVANAGPTTATGVVVRDQLPSGLTFVSSTPSVGSFNTTTGQWAVGSVTASATATLQIVARVDSNTNLSNTAEVFAAGQNDFDSTPNNNVEAEDDQATIVIVPTTADLSLTKTLDNDAPNVGQNVTFTLTVRNDGPSTATGIAVADNLPAGITFISSAPTQGGYNAGTGQWSVGSLAPTATASLQIVGRVDSVGAKTNTAQILSSDQFDPDSTPNNNVPGEDDQDSVTLTPPVADVSITKTVDQARPNSGDTIRYTVTVGNAGPAAATGIVVNDDLPGGLTFAGSMPSVGTYDPGTGLWNLGSIASGGTATLLIDAVVGTTAATTNVAEIVQADQFDPDSTPGNNLIAEDDQASAVFTPASADVSLTKTVSDATPNVGETVTFTINVANAGPDAATGLQVRDLLPTGLTFVSATPGQGTFDSSTGLWTVGSVTASATASLSIVATVNSTILETNTAEVFEVDQRDPDSTPNNNLESEDDQATATLRGQQIDLSLTTTVNDATPNIGDEITFTLTLRNDGVSDASGVQVRDMLPPGLSLRRTVPSQGSFSNTSGTWSVGSLTASATASLEITTRVDQILNITNTAQVIAADQPDVDSTPDNNIDMEDDQASVTVRTPVADLSLTKTVDNERPNIGDTVAFTVIIRNDGPDAATDVQVTDLLPAGIDFVSDSLSQGTYNDTTGIWTVGSLTLDETATLQINGQVVADGISPTAPKTNTAEITAVNEADSDSSPGNGIATEDDQASVTVTPTRIDLSLTKTVSDATPSLGDEVTYTVTVANGGPDAASSVQVRDTLPDGVTLVSVNEFQGSFNAATGVWFVGDIATGNEARLELNVVVDSPGDQINAAEVIAADQFDNDSTPANNDANEDDQASVSLRAQEADLSITKTVSEERPGVGDTITFTLQINNDGPDDAEDIVVRDVLPGGVGFVRSDATRGTYSFAAGEWQIPSLASGQSATLDITVTAERFGDQTNTAEIIASSEFDPDSEVNNDDGDEDDQASVTFSPELIDLALAKTVNDDRPNRGDTITYTLTLSNAGPSTATGVQISDLLADNLTFDGASPSTGTYSPLTGIWNVPSLAPDESITLAIEALVGETAGETNTAEVVAADQPDVDSTPGNGGSGSAGREDDFASVDFATQVADLSLAKSVNRTTADQNEPVIFTVTLINDGPDAATNVVVQDILPAGLTFTEANPSTGTYNANTGEWSIPSVPNNGTATLQLLATISGREPQINTAEVIAVDQFDRDSTPGNGIASEDDIASATVTPIVIDVSVTSMVDNLEPLEGDEITLTFTARNDGPADATGLQFRTILPPGLTLVSVTPERGVYDPATGIWNVGPLANGRDLDLVFRAIVDERGLKRMPIELIAADQIDVDSDPANGVETEDDQNELLIRAPRLLTKRLFLSR